MSSPPAAAAPTPPAWAHAGGHVELTAGARVELDPADRVAVLERPHRYGLGYDERRADVLRECFCAEGIWEGAIAGVPEPVGPFRGADAVVQWLADFWPQQSAQRRHVFTNVSVDSVHGDGGVRVFAYLQLLDCAAQSPLLATSGLYRFDMRREGDAWRIAHLLACFDAPF